MKTPAPRRGKSCPGARRGGVALVDPGGEHAACGIERQGLETLAGSSAVIGWGAEKLAP